MSTALARNSADRYAPDRLTGRQKVAILCMALGTEHAAKITAGLQPDEVEIVALEVSQLDRVPSATIDAVLSEWLELTLGTTRPETGEPGRRPCSAPSGALRGSMRSLRTSSGLLRTCGQL